MTKMSWRFSRQLLIVLAVVLFLGTIGGLVYWYKKPGPNCFDNKKNGSELAVDCGGGCARVCSAEVKPLVNLWNQVFEIIPNTYSVVGMFTNSNTNLGSPSARYIVDYRDSSGRTIATTTGVTFINPGQPVPIFTSNFYSQNAKAAQVFVSFTDIYWQRVDWAVPRVSLRRTNLELLPTPRVTIEVTNNESFDLENVKVVVVVSDADNNAFTSSATVIDKIKANDKAEAYFTWPLPFTTEAAFFDFYTQTNVFNIPHR